MNFFVKYITLIIVFLFLNSCAHYKLQYRDDVKDWASTPLPSKKLSYQVFLIGDAGNSKPGYITAPLQLLKQDLSKADENSAVVFLGDNIYEEGLPEEGHTGRSLAEYRLNAQLDIVKNHAGRIVYVSGNHDWKIDGLDGIRRQEEYIENYLGRDDVYLPENGCSGPTSIELTDKFGLIALNSQWWMTQWDKEPEINEECGIRTREEFFMELMDEVRDFRGKNLLLVGHHPLFSEGWHGGKYSAKEHLFPLSMKNEKNKIPLPIISTFALLLNNSIATRQELNHPIYDEYIGVIEEAARHHGSIMYAAGHEHNLQLHQDDEIDHILSGAASKRSPVGKGAKSPFGYGGMGYAVIKVYEDGEVWVEFIRAKEGIRYFEVNKSPKITTGFHPVKKEETGNYEQLTPEVIFRQKIKEPLITSEALTPDTFPEFETLEDSINISVLEREDMWDLQGWVWGDLWSEEYFKDLKVPILDLENTMTAPLIAYKKGGGFQTTSVRLKDTINNRVYQIRSLEKSAQKMFYPFNKTFAKHILKYNFTAGNPYAAFLLEPMQEAIGTYHTNPQLFYVPKQPNLGAFNRFGGKLYLFEERPDEDWSNNKDFGYSKDLISTGSVLEEVLEGDAIIDQPIVLRNRFFDMLIGDWDRHQDQWRWAEIEIEGKKRELYRPIPRDRDQVFAKYEGLFFNSARLAVPFIRASHPFDGDIKKKEVRWLNFQSRFFDDFFLNELTWSDWEKEVEHIQKNLTDEVIEAGVSWLPDTLYEEMGDFIIASVKQRRDHLLDTAKEYYHFLYKQVRIVGTLEENLFLVERLNDQETKITVFEYLNNDRTEKQLIYDRIFNRKVTEEIQLYGIEGDDVFEVKGEVNKGIKIRLVGGIDEDVFIDESKVKGLGKKTWIYDDLKEDNQIMGGNNTKDLRTNIYELNDWNFRDRQYNFGTPFPILGFNLDDGVFFGVNYQYKDYGFKKMNQHSFKGTFAAATKALSFNYEGTFQNIVKKWDLFLDVDLESPQFVNNYFGLGNETERTTTNRDFFRVRRARYGVFTALKKRTEGGLFFVFGPLTEAIKVEQTENRFLSSDATDVRVQVFERQYFGGFKTVFDYNNVDNKWMPKRGIRFRTEASWRANLTDQDRHFLNCQGSLTTYLPLGVKKRVLYASKIGFDTNFGEFDFFQAARLGGNNNLRGFSQERFAGRTSFYHNNELRIYIIHEDNNFIPVSMGLSPAFDYGRVWIDDEQSNDWHYGYGGNIWLSPLDYVAITFGIMRSVEETRFAFRLGYEF